MRRGVFISFEGSEGCGKSTQIERLCARLAERGTPFLRTREPGGTPIGERIRDLLQYDKIGHEMCPEAELLLFTASRAQLVRQVIQPTLAAGTSIIADRFFDSTTVYQGVARRLESSAVAFANQFAIGDCRPDITFLLDLDLTTSQARLAARGNARPDRMEAQPDAFYAAVRAGYWQLAAVEPERICVLDAARPVDEISAEIWHHLQSRFHGLFT